MNVKINKKSWFFLFVLCGILCYSAYNFLAHAQYVTSTLPPPPPVPDKTIPTKKVSDSIPMAFSVKPTIPNSYSDLEASEHPLDLKTPSNITTNAEYDYETECYIIRTKLGDNEISTPFM